MSEPKIVNFPKENFICKSKKNPEIRRTLIKETLKCGNLGNIKLQKHELEYALSQIFIVEKTENFLERLYLNFKSIYGVYNFGNDDSFHKFDSYTSDGKICSKFYDIICFLKNDCENAVFETCDNYFLDIQSVVDIMVKLYLKNINNTKRYFTMCSTDFRNVISSYFFKKDFAKVTPKNNDILYYIFNISTHKKYDVGKNHITLNTYKTVINLGYFPSFKIKKFNNEVHEIICDKSLYLFEHAPEYFKIVKPLISSILINSKYCISYDTVKILNLISIELFPELENIDCITSLAFNIYILEPILRSYVLGFDPMLGPVPKHSIIEAILHLSKYGIVNYSKLVLTPRTSFKFEPKLAGSVEKEDCMLNDIADYCSFDIIHFYENEHLFRFTRPEFKLMYDKGVNSITKVEFSDATFLTLTNKIVMAKKYNFPPSQPYCEMLKSFDY